MRKIAMLLAAPMALISLTTPATAQEGRGQPFITAAHYQENISLAEFQVNPRSYFRSEDAFRLIVRYVSDEVGRELTAAEFIALMRDDTQTRVRDLQPAERINTGAYDASQFHWFVRGARTGEQVVQVLVSGVWKDVFSLGCLNAVEDKTPASPPALTTTLPPVPQRPPVVITTTVAPSAAEGSVTGPFLYGYPVAPMYRGGNTNINAGSRARSASASSSTSGTPGCTTACGGHASVRLGHISGE